MTNEMKDQNQKATLLQTLLLVLWSLTTAALAVLLVLEVAATLKTETLVVKEPIEVTSSSLSPMGVMGKTYSSQVTGVIFNTSSRAIRVENLRITVKAEGAEHVVELETFLIPARSSHSVEASFVSGHAYYAVDRISLEYDGEREVLSNLVSENGWEKSGVALMLYAVLLVPSTWLLVTAAKKRYYLFQEAKMQA